MRDRGGSQHAAAARRGVPEVDRLFRSLARLALAGAPLMACTTAGGAGARTTGAEMTDRDAAPDVTAHVFTLGDESRPYRLFVPASAPNGLAPLVVMLHGCTQTAADFATGTRMDSLARARGVVVVYPEQIPERNPQRCWQWFDPAHQRRDAGEPALIAGITREVMARTRADPSRTYVAGMSAGALMALAVGLSYPDLYAAIASHSGAPYGVATDVAGALALMRTGAADSAAAGRAALEAMGPHARLIPLLSIHGDADGVVVPANQRALEQQWMELTRLLGERGLVAGKVTREFALDGDQHSARGFAVGDATVLVTWTVRGLGHAWSGGSPEGSYTEPTGPDASNLILSSLLRHRRP